MSHKSEVMRQFLEGTWCHPLAPPAGNGVRPASDRALARAGRRGRHIARSLPANARWRAWEDRIAPSSGTPPLYVSGYVAVDDHIGQAVLRPVEPRRGDDPAVLRLGLEFHGTPRPAALAWQKTTFEMSVDPLRYTGVEILSDGRTMVELDIEIVE